MCRIVLNLALFLCAMKTRKTKRINWSIYSYISTLLFFFFLILGSVITIINTSKELNMYKLQAILRLFYSLIILWVFVHCQMNKRKFMNIFSRFDENSPNFLGHDEIKITAVKFVKQAKRQIVLTGGVVFVGFIGGLITNNQREDLYYFLHRYSCGLSDDIAPVIGYCFKKRSYGHFILNKIMAIYILFYESFMIHVGWVLEQMVFQSLVAKIQLHDDRLPVCIKKIKAMKKFDTKDRLELASVVKYQQSIFE